MAYIKKKTLRATFACAVAELQADVHSRQSVMHHIRVTSRQTMSEVPKWSLPPASRAKLIHQPSLKYLL